ncbi:MAG: hypothetical protein EHM57_02400 [Actinobacteria bacterium]|nr:MAG: hypothetical protein EHM57_02400 [Actinomycetota bacterium]
MGGWRRLLPLVAAGGVVAIAVYAAGAIGATTTSTTTSSTFPPSLIDEEASTSTTLAGIAEVLAYRRLVLEICTDADARLDEELFQMTGLVNPVAPVFEFLAEEDVVVYYEAARGILAETIQELHAVRPPDAVVAAKYEPWFVLLEEFANGADLETPGSVPPAGLLLCMP